MLEISNSAEKRHLKHKEMIRQYADKMMIPFEEGAILGHLSRTIFDEANDTTMMTETESSEVPSSEEPTIHHHYVTAFAHHLDCTVNNKVENGTIHPKVSRAACKELNTRARSIASNIIPCIASDDDLIFDYNSQLKLQYFSQRLGRLVESHFHLCADLVDDMIVQANLSTLIGVIDTLCEIIIGLTKTTVTQLIEDNLLEAVITSFYNNCYMGVLDSERAIDKIGVDVEVAATSIADYVSSVVDDIVTDIVLGAFESMQESQAMDDVVEKFADIEI